MTQQLHPHRQLGRRRLDARRRRAPAQPPRLPAGVEIAWVLGPGERVLQFELGARLAFAPNRAVGLG